MGSYWSAVNRVAKGHSFRLWEEWKEVKAQRLKQSQAERTRGAHGGSSAPGLQVEGRAGGPEVLSLQRGEEDEPWSVCTSSVRTGSGEAGTRISFPSRVLMWVVFQETPAVAKKKKKKSYRVVPIKLVQCNFTRFLQSWIVKRKSEKKSAPLLKRGRRHWLRRVRNKGVYKEKNGRLRETFFFFLRKRERKSKRWVDEDMKEKTKGLIFIFFTFPFTFINIMSWKWYIENLDH